MDTINTALNRAFCASMDVASVPVGYAVTTGFRLPDGDPLSFYVIPSEDGRFHLEDDGLTLPNAIAAGLDLKSPIRDGLLRGILAEEGVDYTDDLSIRSAVVDEESLAALTLRFVSALIRTRDLALLSRENVAASFADDVRRELAESMPPTLEIEEHSDPTSSESADIIIRDRSTHIKTARIFAAGSDLRLMDALVDFQARRDGESAVIAVVDRRRNRVSERRFNTATNRGLPMAVVDGPDGAWVARVMDIAAHSQNPSSVH